MNQKNKNYIMYNENDFVEEGILEITTIESVISEIILAAIIAFITIVFIMVSAYIKNENIWILGVILLIGMFSCYIISKTILKNGKILYHEKLHKSKIIKMTGLDVEIINEPNNKVCRTVIKDSYLLSKKCSIYSLLKPLSFYLLFYLLFIFMLFINSVNHVYYINVFILGALITEFLGCHHDILMSLKLLLKRNRNRDLYVLFAKKNIVYRKKS